MADKYADIRARLEAVTGVEWGDPQTRYEEEFYGDWVMVYPVLVFGKDREAQALAEFIRHAAEDIRRLLEEVQDR